MDNSDQVILKLTCATCDNPECEIGPRCVSADSLIGCIRRVPENIYDQYIHYMKEVIPFWHLYKMDYINNSYFEIYNFLQEIYTKYPIINRTDKNGKVIIGG